MELVSIEIQSKGWKMSKDYIEITYRDIAKMFASTLTVEGEDFAYQVETNLEAIKALPLEAKHALKVAFVFSRKVPRHERQDVFNDIALTVLKLKTKDERLAYAIARCDWQDWWRKYSVRQHYSLDSITEDDEGNPVTLAETIVGEVEFERKMDGKLDAQRIWNKLPDSIKPLVSKRLLGYALTNYERNMMSRYVRKQGYQLILA